MAVLCRMEAFLIRLFVKIVVEMAGAKKATGLLMRAFAGEGARATRFRLYSCMV